MEHTDSLTPKIVIEPSKGWISLKLGEVWQYRELLFFLIWRDVKVRYKQTVLGIAWAIIQPLVTMVIFSLIFGQLAKLPSEGIPYPVFCYAALLPWQLFSGALTRCGTSLVGNANLLTKIYFPRLIIPLSATLSGLVDFSISRHPVRAYVVFRHFTHLGHPMVTTAYALCVDNGFVCRIVAISSQCPVPGCSAYHPFSHTGMDVRFTDCLLG